ncbi:MAG: hypothetical protein FJ088_07250, partial [Deltaproteobacteria bacterium]|nr:hypothetical protein [Deltaproteobacteria bacterium]
MPLKGGNLFNLIYKAVSRDITHFIFSGIGLIVGTATLTLFLSLSSGIRERVINRIYPVNLVELEPAKVSRVGIISDAGKINADTIAGIGKIGAVENVYPKQKSKFQAILWGGASLFGRDAHTEAFFDGISPELVRNEPLFADHGEVVTCSSDKQCLEGEKCSGGICTGAGEFVKCSLNDPRDQFSGDEKLLRGIVSAECDGPGRDCVKQCPDGTYCAAVSVVSKEGYCEKPVPVLISPFLVEVYN